MRGKARGFIKMHRSKPYMEPDSPYYKDMCRIHNNKQSNDWYDNGFKSSALYK